MSKVIINDIESDLEITEHETFSDIMKSIHQVVTLKNEIITVIELNGKRLTETEEREAFSLPASEITQLHIHAIHRKNLIFKTITDLLSFVVNIIPYTQKISELFRTAGEEEANKEYEKYLDELNLFLVGADTLLNALKLDIENESINGQTIAALQKKILTTTKEMHDVQKNKDWIMLADLLEYELVKHLQDWKELLQTIEGFFQKTLTTQEKPL